MLNGDSLRFCIAEISPGSVLMESVLGLENKAGKQGILFPAIAM